MLTFKKYCIFLFFNLNVLILKIYFKNPILDFVVFLSKWIIKSKTACFLFDKISISWFFLLGIIGLWLTSYGGLGGERTWYLGWLWLQGESLDLPENAPMEAKDGVSQRKQLSTPQSWWHFFRTEFLLFKLVWLCNFNLLFHL